MTPTILESNEWYAFANHDKSFKRCIIEQIEKEISDTPSDPISLAKYGKIWFLLGNYNAAKEYLEQAVDMLPNLESPWICLEKIASRENNLLKQESYRRKLKLWGYIDNSSMKYQNFSDNGEDKSDLLIIPHVGSNYFIKFSLWYQAPLDQDVLNFNFIPEYRPYNEQY